MSVTLEDVRAAAGILRGHVERTPLCYSRTLSQLSGAEVWLKLENQQFTAAFKERGALVKLSSLGPDERRRGVIAMSRGNHAQAVAYHGARLGIPVVIVMPRFTPNPKVEHTRAFGAEVVLHGDDLEACAKHAYQLAEQRSLCFVHPFDDEKVIAGQGTVALEMLEQQPDLEVLLLSVGGGGLIAGCAIAAHGLRPEIEIVGVQTAAFPTMRQILAGDPVHGGGATVAEGIAVAQPGQLTRKIVREHVREILLVEEQALETSVRLLLEIEKTVVEGAGAAPLAALLSHRGRFAGRRVGLVLSGGNIDLLVLSSIIQRELVRSARLARLTVELRDVPGALADISALIGQAGCNVVEVHHQRAFTTAALSQAEVLFVIETRGPEHLAEVTRTLRDAGYSMRG